MRIARHLLCIHVHRACGAASCMRVRNAHASTRCRWRAELQYSRQHLRHGCMRWSALALQPAVESRVQFHINLPKGMARHGKPAARHSIAPAVPPNQCVTHRTAEGTRPSLPPPKRSPPTRASRALRPTLHASSCRLSPTPTRTPTWRGTTPATRAGRWAAACHPRRTAEAAQSPRTCRSTRRPSAS